MSCGLRHAVPPETRRRSTISTSDSLAAHTASGSGNPNRLRSRLACLIRGLLPALLAISLLLSAGCLSRLEDGPMEITYYTLHYQPSPVQGQRLPVILEIDPLASGPNCDFNTIIYQNRDLKRQEYAYHRWRAKPGALVTWFLRRDLQHSGLFQAVIPEQSRVDPTHRLEGTVEEFLEVDGQEGWQAVVDVSLTLVDARTEDIRQTVVWQKRYTLKEQAEAKTVRSIVQAMSRAMARLSRQVALDVHHAFSRQP
jgi:cholesterol transport system auxiliary component